MRKFFVDSFSIRNVTAVHFDEAAGTSVTGTWDSALHVSQMCSAKWLSQRSIPHIVFAAADSAHSRHSSLSSMIGFDIVPLFCRLAVVVA
jgi:hypothetical protein